MKVQNGLAHLFRAALADFKRNKVRTLLTSLGIMIGVLSVVMLIALGLGLKNYLKQTFENLGANLVMIMPGSGFGGGGFSPAGMFGGVKFDEKDVRNLARVANVKYAVPLFFTSTTVESGSKEKLAYVMGVNTDHFKLMNADVVVGELFEKSDVQARAKVAVLGYNIADNLFENIDDVVGKTIRFSDQRFKVIGVIDKTGDNEQDNSIIIPYKTTYGSMNPDKTFWAIYLGVEDEDNVESVKERVEETLLKRYKEDEFSVTEQSELLSTVNQIFNILNGVLIAIGSISLVVGGIGIMNIMYASVTERTREVGIRRAVGATQRDILMQFLTESVLLSVFGGLLGLSLATLIVLLVRPFFPMAINLSSVTITLAISSGIGIFFGVFPARRAAKLPPIGAIRYE
jgi:putative ABC transport system permease protein